MGVCFHPASVYATVCGVRTVRPKLLGSDPSPHPTASCTICVQDLNLAMPTLPASEGDSAHLVGYCRTE